MSTHANTSSIQPSPHGGRGWLNRQIEPGEGAWAFSPPHPSSTSERARKSRCPSPAWGDGIIGSALPQFASEHPQYSSAHRGSRSELHESPALPASRSVRHQWHRNAGHRPLRRSAAHQHTGSQQCSALSALVGGTQRLSVADCASAATARAPNRSRRGAGCVTGLSGCVHAPSISPHPDAIASTLSRKGERVNWLKN